jgi:hypothetical protein
MGSTVASAVAGEAVRSHRPIISVPTAHGTVRVRHLCSSDSARYRARPEPDVESSRVPDPTAGHGVVR